MADNQSEQILFSLTLNAQQFKDEQAKTRQALADLVLSMEATKKKGAELEASRKAGKVADAEYAQQSVKLREELNAQQASQRLLTKALAATGQQAAAAGEQQAASASKAANSLAGLRAKLVALQATRETLDPTTKEAEELNTTILKLQTSIAEGSGKIDAFGEKIKTNIRKENFDTVQDSVQGLIGTMSAATIIFGDNTDAAKAQAKALQLMALAQDARNIAIGLGSAREAASIVWTKARNLILKEQTAVTATAVVSTETHAAITATDAAAIEAQAAAAALGTEAQAAGTAATVANTVATEAQAVATTGATLASRLAAIAVRAFGLAMSLTPIGILLVGLAALVGGVLAYSSASDKTKERVNKLTEALFRYTTPVGLAVTVSQKLYERFELVRRVIDPVIARVNALTGYVADNARKFGEWAGILDTAKEKAAALAVQTQELAQATITQIEAEAKAMELNGARQAAVRAKLRDGLLLDLKTKQDTATKQEAADQEQHAKQLARIAAQLQAGETLNDKDKEFHEKSQERLNAVRAAKNALKTFDQETIEQQRVARAAEAADIENNTERAIVAYRRRIEEGIASEKAALQSRIGVLDRSLALVQINSEKELELQRKRVLAQRDLDLLNLGPTLAQERAVKQKFLDRELADQQQQRNLDLAQHNLTAQQKQHIENDYANKAADTRLAFSTAQAQREVAARRDIVAQASADQLKLDTDHLRQVSLTILQAEQERNSASLALNAKAQAEQSAQGLKATQQQLAEQYQLQSRAVVLERELALAGLETRKDKAATELRIYAEANRKLAELDAAQADTARQRRAKELSEQAQQYDLLADRMLAGHNQAEQQQIQATETYKQQRLAAVFDEEEARLATVEKGSQEEANIRQEAANKIAQIEEQSSQAQLANIKDKYDKIAGMASQSLSALSTIQDAASQDQLNRIQQEMNLSTTSQAKKAVLAKQQQRIEKEQHERQQKYAIAQAIIDGGSAVMRIIATSNYTDFGISAALEVALAVATTIAQVRAISSQKFAHGGIAYGPSHAQGGIQLYHRGQPAGIEIEGGEPVLTAAVSRSPVLLSMASMINQLAGGRPLYTDPTPSSTWARWADGGVVSSSAMYLPQVRTGGVVQAATAPIDYDLLTDMMAAKMGREFVKGAQALPPQNLNLTELEDRQDSRRKTKLQTDI